MNRGAAGSATRRNDASHLQPQQGQPERDRNDPEQPAAARRRNHKGGNATHPIDGCRNRERTGNISREPQHTIRAGISQGAHRTIWQFKRDLNSGGRNLHRQRSDSGPRLRLLQLRCSDHHLLPHRSRLRADVQLLEREQTSKDDGCGHVR